MSEPELQKLGDHGEIVIVRRGNRGEDCHHGGVWKVAFADFMTAMMAFFLVMWLVNAANEETKVQVASYFNPVKLVDSTTNPRGLKEDPKTSSGDVRDRKLNPEARPKVGRTGETDREQVHQTAKEGPVAYYSGGDIPESELFRNPIRSLERIVGGAPDIMAGSDARDRRKAVGMAGGEAFRDPFAPRAWDMLADDLPPEDAASQGGEDIDRRHPAGDDSTRERNRHAATAAAGREGAPGRAGKVSSTAADGQGRKAEGAIREERQREEELARRIEERLRKALQKLRAGRRPVVQVKRVAEGVLISLSDQAGFGMFRVGSARPLPETVRFMEKVGQVLRDMPGTVIIRGHTDARPYRTRHYDNWQLSTARAHMARYMLLRGGLPPERIERIEGVADREPAVPEDPYHARNRRIEILLKPRAEKKEGTLAKKRQQ
jgi:chemotaxis protein MotB